LASDLKTETSVSSFSETLGIHDFYNDFYDLSIFLNGTRDDQFRILVGDLGKNFRRSPEQYTSPAREHKNITCPVLFIRGDQEPKENYPAQKFAKNCPGSCEVAIILNCDHFYVGAEDKVSKIVTD